MSDYKCPNGYEHITDDSISVEKVSTGTRLFQNNHITCYNAPSLSSSVITCRYEDDEIVGRWHLCQQESSTSSGDSVPWTEVLVPIAFFAFLAGLLIVMIKWKWGNMSQRSFRNKEVYKGCERSISDIEMPTSESDVQAGEGKVTVKEEHQIENEMTPN